MNDLQIVDLTREAIVLSMKISAPVLITGLVVGVIISIIQTVTQIQEMTLTFVPKMIAVFAVCAMLMPAMITIMQNYMTELATIIISTGAPE